MGHVIFGAQHLTVKGRVNFDFSKEKAPIVEPFEMCSTMGVSLQA